MLSHFQRLLKLHRESRRARVENAVETSPELMSRIQDGLARRYGPGLDVTFWINPDLLGGLRVRVGSDVYDGSVKARLDGLKDTF
jgi:F-type H+-transporting ATPase subunit delta